MTTLYPLRFQEVLRNYSFGGRWITEVYNKADLPEDHTIAETWEVCDRPNGESNVLLNGPLAGKALHELIETFGVEFLGTDTVARRGKRFPLLIKFLDASNVLGEQIHLSDELAAQRGLTEPGKTEAWYMLFTKPGATIHYGNQQGVTHDQAYAAIMDGSIKDLMVEVPVKPGDAFLLYAGTMHYARGGVIFYEIMENSDVTIGLRPPKADLPEAERHQIVEDMLEGIHLENDFDVRIPPVTVAEGDNQHTYVFCCQFFSLERLDLVAPYTIDCNGEKLYVLSQIEGKSTIRFGDQVIDLEPGLTTLLPASIGKVTIEPDGPCALLKSYVPDLAKDIVATLRAQGVADEQIVALGGRTRLNPLTELM